MLHAPLPVLLVKMQDDFGIGTRGELMPRCRELLPQRQIVIDFTVEHDRLVPVLVENRLITGIKVDDAQPGHTELKAISPEIAGAVGAAMLKSRCDVLDKTWVLVTENSCDTTHVYAVLSSCE